MKLSEMSLTALWELFPVVLKPHDPKYFDWFDEECAKLKAITDDGLKRISHIGSTAVPRLLSKPTVDILLEVDPSADVTALKSRITDDGWLIMSDTTQPDMRISFNKGYTENGYAEKVYHLHVRELADHDELYFRDYLCAHKEVADAYGKLKLALLDTYKHDRDGYTNAKSDFIKEYTAKARTEFSGRFIANCR